MAALLFVFAFCLVAVLVYMARYSGRVRVTHTRTFHSTIGEVYAKVADFRHWGEWSPWLEHEPDAIVTLSDKTDSEGSKYTWHGTRSGAGLIEHVRMAGRERIEQRMGFKHPFRIRCRSHWQFAERAGETEVTWSMNGRVAFPVRAFAQTVQGIMALDCRYGMDRLARLVEPADAPSYSLSYLGVRDIPATRYVYRTYEGPINGLSAAASKNFAKLRQDLASYGIQPSGEPIAVYVKTNIKRRTTACFFGIPIPDYNDVGLPTRILPAQQAYVICLQGSYTGLEVAWYQAMQRMRIEDIPPDPRVPPFERYLNDPGTVPENNQATELHIAVRPRAPQLG